MHIELNIKNGRVTQCNIRAIDTHTRTAHISRAAALLYILIHTCLLLYCVCRAKDQHDITSSQYIAAGCIETAALYYSPITFVFISSFFPSTANEFKCRLFLFRRSLSCNLNLLQISTIKKGGMRR